MLAWMLSSISSGAVTAVVGQIASIYAKSKDDKLAGLQAVVGMEATENPELVKAQVENNRIKAAGGHNIVALTVVFLFNVPFALHIAAITLDSIYHFGWNVSPLPSPELQHFEMTSLESFIPVAVSLPLLSAAAQRLASKL